MGETYGMLPTEVMDQAPADFWLNAAVRMATNGFKQEVREQERGAQSGPGVASHGQKRDLVEANEDRAERREAMDGQPDMTDQMAALRGETDG